MAIEHTDAIILRITEFSETSCVVTLWTRDFGKLSGLAKGARRRKSAFEGALDLLAVCHVGLLRKSGDVLHLLTEVRQNRRFRAASRDLGRLYAGFYIAELLLALTEDLDPVPELYDLAEQTLSQLDGQGDAVAWLARFQMRALALLGHRPSLEDCVLCGKPVETAESVAISLAAGGILCPGCRVGQRWVVSISDQSRRVLLALADESRDDWNNTIATGPARGEVRGLLEQYVTHVMGRRPKMAVYLRTTI